MGKSGPGLGLGKATQQAAKASSLTSKASKGGLIAGGLGLGAMTADELLSGGKGVDGLAAYGYDKWSAFTQGGAQIGVDGTFAGFYAIVEKVALMINSIGGANEGMSLDIANWARQPDHQVNKEQLFYTPDGLVEHSQLSSSHPSHVPLDIKSDEGVDNALDKGTYKTAFNDAMTNQGYARDFSRVDHVLAGMQIADPEIGDEVADMYNNAKLMKMLTSAVNNAANPADITEKVAGLHEGLRQGQGLENAMKNVL